MGDEKTCWFDDVELVVECETNLHQLQTGVSGRKYIRTRCGSSRMCSGMPRPTRNSAIFFRPERMERAVRNTCVSHPKQKDSQWLLVLIVEH